MSQLQDKVALITGAAGSIGAAIARRFVAEGASRGIRVNSVHPGPVDNVFQHRIEAVATGESEARAAAIFETMIPLGRHATPEEVAALVLFLASDESTFMTGATIPLDGGMSV